MLFDLTTIFLAVIAMLMAAGFVLALIALHRRRALRGSEKMAEALRESAQRESAMAQALIEAGRREADAVDKARTEGDAALGRALRLMLKEQPLETDRALDDLLRREDYEDEPVGAEALRDGTGSEAVEEDPEADIIADEVPEEPFFLRMEKEQLEEKVAELQEEKRRLTDERDEARGAADALRKEKEDGQKEVLRMKGDEETYKKEIAELQKEKADLEVSCSEAAQKYAEETRLLREKSERDDKSLRELQAENERLAAAADGADARTVHDLAFLREGWKQKDRRIMQLQSEIRLLRMTGSRRQDDKPQGPVVDIDKVIAEEAYPGVREAFRRVGIMTTGDAEAWSAGDLRKIPMVDESVVAVLTAYGCRLSEDSSAEHLSLIALPPLKHGVPEVEDVRGNALLMAPVTEWHAKTDLPGILLVRLGEYGIASVAELAMRQAHELSALPGVGELATMALRKALRAEDLDLGMSQSDIKAWAGKRSYYERKREAQDAARQKKLERAAKKTKREAGADAAQQPAGRDEVAPAPAVGLEAELEKIDVAQMNVVSFGPFPGKTEEFKDITGIRTAADLVALRPEDLALIQCVNLSYRVMPCLARMDLKLDVFPARREAIIAAHEIYRRGEEAAAIPMEKILFNRPAFVRSLAENGITTLGDVARRTHADMMEILHYGKIVDWLTRTCRDHGLGVAEGTSGAAIEESKAEVPSVDRVDELFMETF